jgi:hypothetical protein
MQLFNPMITKRSNIICRYATCPAQNCHGLVIPEFEPEDRKLFVEQSHTWYLQCTVCQRPFKVHDSDLRIREISVNWIRQVYSSKA